MSTIRALILGAFLVAWVPHATSAQQALRAPPADTLTLHDAVAAALLVHPGVAQAGAVVERAAAGRREVQASLLPALSLESTATRFQEPMLVAPLHGIDVQRLPEFDRTLLQSSLTLAYSLFDGGARGARLERASWLRESARAQLEQAEHAVIAETASRYAAVLVARELAAAQSSRVSALEAERGRAAQLLEQGRAARVVLLRAEASLSAARAEHAATRLRAESAERELARLLGVADARLVLTPARVRAPVIARDDALAEAYTANAELRRLARAADAAAASVGEARAQWWPRLHFGGRYMHYASGAGTAVGEWQAGVQLSYAVFTAGARPAAIDRARAELSFARAEVAAARLRVGDAVDRALSAVEAAAARADAWSTAVVQMEEVVRIERLALDTGAGVQTDWLGAQAELLRARAAFTEARYDQLLARIELARVMGVLSPAWILNNVESGV